MRERSVKWAIRFAYRVAHGPDLRDIEIATDLAGKKIVDFTVAGNGRGLPSGRWVPVCRCFGKASIWRLSRLISHAERRS
jgi:hypothetical protein